MSLGQYVAASQIVPACCATIVRDMIAAASKNSNIIYTTLQNPIKVLTRKAFNLATTQRDIDIIKENNISIISSLKSLCEILREHNKRFTRSSSELNLAVGTAVHPMEEKEVHTPMINAVGTLLNSLETLPSFGEARTALAQALEKSVRFE